MANNSGKLASLIISVYKNTEFLKAVLDALPWQTEKRYELIISEDGQSREMEEFIRNYPFEQEYIHLQQEDLGWRKNRALNRAIQAATTDWLIFIDGDCILHPRFIESHLRWASPDSILAGKRIKLDPYSSALFLEKKLDPARINTYLIGNYKKIKSEGGQFLEEGFFVDPDGFLGIIPRMRKMRHLKGCNMSFHKTAIQRINGFDEEYKKPAVGEDADLLWRFAGMGYTLKSLRNLAVQYHLYHKESWTDQEENLRMMNRNRASNKFICDNGLIKK